MAAETVRIKGIRELNSALARYDKELKKELERELRDAAQKVADSARARFAGIDQKSAMGFRPRIRGFGRVVVEQRYRKTTGQHPNFGSLQMRRALLPALASESDNVVRALEGMLDRLGLEEGF